MAESHMVLPWTSQVIFDVLWSRTADQTGPTL
jgi:hypothetical protein